MPKIIDFSNGESSHIKPLIMQPNFDIRGDKADIEFKMPKGVPTFYIHVGCQGVNINPTTVENAIQEINGIPYEPVPTKVLVEKGKIAKSSSPKLKDEAGNWYISSTNGAFSKDTHEVKVLDIKQKRKYFSPNTGWDQKDFPFQFRGGYTLSRIDADKIKSILNKIKEFFEEGWENEETMD